MPFLGRLLHLQRRRMGAQGDYIMRSIGSWLSGLTTHEIVEYMLLIVLVALPIISATHALYRVLKELS